MLKYFQGANLSQADIKFNIYDFYYRIKKVQKICQKEQVDGLLIITGIDSRENIEYTKLINWLFLGHSGVEIETNEFLDKSLCELVMIIKPNGLSIFIDRDGWDELKNKISIIPNIELFVPTEIQNENKDEYELLKITQFLKIMQGIQTIGVLLGKKDQGQVKNLERWPLINSYGIQELGKGFFSMNHKPIDMTQRVNQVYKVHDKHSLKKIINITANRLYGHLTSAVGQISDVKMKKRSQITEEQLCEVFTDTFEIEELNKFLNRPIQSDKYPLKPRILIGKNTRAPYHENSSSISFQDQQINTNTPPLHLTVEAFDLLTSLRCARTYFTTRHVKQEFLLTEIINQNMVIDEYLKELIEVPYVSEETLLIKIYQILFESFQEGMQAIAKDYKNLNEQFLSSLIIPKIQKLYQELNLPQQKHSENLQIALASYNSFGEEVPINFKDSITFKLTPYFFMIRLQYSNIQNLGAVLFAESFILQENCYVLITKSIPYVNIYNIGFPQHSEAMEGLRKRLEIDFIGKQISDLCDNNQIFIPTGFDLPIYKGSIFYHTKGLRIGCDNLGWFFIPFTDINRVQLITGNNFDHNWALFTFKKNNFLLNTIGIQSFALEFRGKAVDQIFFPMKQQLEQLQIPIQQSQEIPNEFILSQIGRTLIKPEVGLKPITFYQNNLLDSQYLLDYLESKQLTILNQMKELKLANFKILQENQQLKQQIDPRIGLIMITGGPSAGKTRFAQNLMRYASDSNCYLSILKFSHFELAALDENGWLLKLEETIFECKNTKTNKQKVILCIVPFFLNIDDLINKVEQSKLVYLRCVVNKINANYFYIGENNQIYQTIIEYSLNGYCQTVIIDTFGNYESYIDDIQKLLRAILPNQQIFRINNNIVFSSLAQTILKDTTYTTNFNIYNRTKLAVLRNLQRDLHVDKIFVPWKIPLKKEKARKLLKEAISPKQTDITVNPKLSQEEQDLKKLVIKVKQLEDQSKPIITYIKGFMRYDGLLTEGLVEISGNKNYITEREVKNISIQVQNIQLDGQIIQDATYMGFEYEQEIGFLFIGSNINRQYCESILQKLIRDPPQLQPFIKREDLSQEIIKNIEFTNRVRDLDHGYFYDGCNIRDEDGMILPHHPKLEIFIQEYLNQENNQIQKQNQIIIKQWEAYLKVFQ